MLKANLWQTLHLPTRILSTWICYCDFEFRILVLTRMICAFFVLLVQSFSYLFISHFEKFLSINTSTLQSGASRKTIRHSFSLVPMATHWFLPVVALLSRDINWSQAFVSLSFTEDVKNVYSTCSTCRTAVLFPDNSVICLLVLICFICFSRKGFPLSAINLRSAFIKFLVMFQFSQLVKTWNDHWWFVPSENSTNIVRPSSPHNSLCGSSVSIIAASAFRIKW